MVIWDLNNLYVLKSKAKKKILVIKNGDHSLSNKKQLKKIVQELNSMIKNIL